MNNNKEFIKSFSGVILNGDRRIVFTSTDFLFRFMSEKCYGEGNGKDKCYLEPDAEGFIYGLTHGGRQIAINIGKKKIELYHVVLYQAKYFLIAEQNIINPIRIEEFQYDTITLCNGSLRHILYPIVMDYSKMDRDGFPQKLICDRTYSIGKHSVSSLRIYSTTTEGLSDKNGISKYTNSCMDIKLIKRCSLGGFYAIYRRVITLLSFLIYSKYIAFDKILLTDSDNKHGKGIIVYYDSAINKYENLHGYNCIHFEQLDSKVVSNLFGNIIDNKNQPVINFDLFKEIDESPFYIDNSGAYELISCIEREYGLQRENIKNIEDTSVNVLIKNTKCLIKNFRKSNPNAITERTYNLIYGSINHWRISVAAKLKLLLNKYEEVLLNFMDMLDYNFINEANIEKDVGILIKYRNGLIHRDSQGELSKPDPIFCFVVLGILYCSILDRSGCEMSKIKELLTYEFFNKFTQSKLY